MIILLGLFILLCYIVILLFDNIHLVFYIRCFRFQGLEVPEFEEDSQAPSKRWNPDDFACARIDIKKFSQFLCGQQINPYKVICSKYERLFLTKNINLVLS